MPRSPWLIPNAVEAEGFDPEETPGVARCRLGWEAGFTVGYAGTVGLGQGIGGSWRPPVSSTGM